MGRARANSWFFMFTVRAERKGRRAFTLLEITLAVAIFGMMALAIFRFVSAHITAVRISSELNEVDASYGGLERLLTDPHSPSEQRTAIVRNLDPWYPAFNVQSGQKLYLAPADRVRIW